MEFTVSSANSVPQSITNRLSNEKRNVLVIFGFCFWLRLLVRERKRVDCC
jgi:hypothetical protein